MPSPMKVVEWLTLATLGGGVVVATVSPGPIPGLDTLVVNMPANVSPGYVLWSEHVPEVDAELVNVGFTASVVGVGPGGSTATYLLKANGATVCTLSLACDVAAGTHLHANCTATELSPGALLSLEAGASQCLGGAFPMGTFSNKFRW